jgi:integrase
MAEPEITAYLTHLAVEGKVSASTQNQALSAILFLYRNVLSQELEFLDDVVRAKRPTRLPVVYHREEVERVLAQLHGGKWLMASLLYGSGLRLMECLRMRVKDLDIQYRQITVRDGKGEKDRITMFPGALIEPLNLHRPCRYVRQTACGRCRCLPPRGGPLRRAASRGHGASSGQRDERGSVSASEGRQPPGRRAPQGPSAKRRFPGGSGG